MEQILSYFPELDSIQISQLHSLKGLYTEWNSKINVISRKDLDNLYERHVLHSMAMALFYRFPDASTILDVGTGGGFPGIPLALLFPTCQFTLIDSIGKKITVVKEICQAAGIKNIVAMKCNVTELKQNFNFVVSRAVCEFPLFVKMTTKNIIPQKGNGILYLKGGNLDEELSAFREKVKVYELSQYLPTPFFETKKLVYLPLF
jgi:16S rRNA (guanine527-N7)-methyltransferase